MPGFCGFGSFGSYRLPAVQDASIMPTNGHEALTSFAENPTKSVERDALVESQFTRADQVEKTHVKSKWLSCKSKQCNKIFSAKPIFVCIFLTVLILFTIGIIAALSYWTSGSKPAQEVIVYTLPSQQEETSTMHAKLILPGVFENLNMHKEAEDELEEQTTTIEATSPTTTEQVVETTEEPTTTTTTTTAPTTTSQENLQFDQNMGGEITETCLERFAMGSPSGIYHISAAEAFNVYCDMETTTGGWTVIQRRTDREGSFHKRTMDEYVKGFGDLRGNHWLGLEKLSQLAPAGRWAPATLRIEIEGDICDLTCSKRFPNTWAGEWNIQIGGAKEGFRLTVQDSHFGNLTFNNTDPMMEANGAKFSTVDQDQDDSDFINCAQFRMLGPWWHGSRCSDVALNGYYQTTAEKYDTSDRNQNAKRYFVWAFNKQTMDGNPYIIHVRKSLMLLKPSF